MANVNNGVQAATCDAQTEQSGLERENAARYRILYEANPLMYFVLDREGRVVSVNERGVERLGYTQAELIGRSVLEIFHPEDQAHVAAQVELLRQNPNRVHQWEFRKINRAGEIVYVAENARLLPQENGEDLFLVTCEDITERVTAEDNRRAAVKKLETVAEREALVNRISNAVRQSLKVEDVFRTVVNELGKHLAVDRCILYLFDQSDGYAHAVAGYSGVIDGVMVEDYDVPLGSSRAMLEKIIKDDYAAFDDVAASELLKQFNAEFLQPRDVRSLMAVGIRVGDNLTGVLTFTTVRRPRTWTQSEAALACAVADQAGIAIRQAELYQRAEASSVREKLVNQIGIAIRSSLRLPDVWHSATHELGRVLDASRVYIRFFDAARFAGEATFEYEYAAETHPPTPSPGTVSYNNNFGQRLRHNLETIKINDTAALAAEHDDLREQVTGVIAARGVRSAVYCPLMVKDDFRGTICIEQTDRVRQWTENDLLLIEAVAAQLSLGIAQAELHELTRRAKREWEATYDAMSDGVFIYDVNSRLLRVNRAGAEMEQTPPQFLVGRKCCEVIQPDEATSECIVGQVLRTGRSVTVEQQSKRLRRPLLISAEPLLDEGEHLFGVVCTVRDLYELRQMEAIARERQSLLTHLLNGILEPIFAVDADGKLLWCNQATIEIYRSAAGELARRHFLDMVHPEDRKSAEAAFVQSLQKQPQYYESRFVTGTGDTRHAVFNSVPLIGEGQTTTGVLWFVRDVTEQKIALEQTLQADKLRALGQLASGVAHDFNNVLAAIMGRVELLRRQIQDPAAGHSLHIIETAARDAAATVQRIQTFARQGSSQEFETLDIVELIRDSIEITRTRWENEARSQGVRYNVELQTLCSEKVRGVASELREVFVNLIVNALDAMPEGGDLDISCGRGGNGLVLRFADTGMGIAEELRERIFEPFFTTKGVYGNGLGLSVSYGIVERHGGRIKAASEIGIGTVFTIELPMPEIETPFVALPSEVITKEQIKALVVDDEQFVRETLVEMLGELDHEATGVTNGKDALAQLARESFDVVFTDLSMPEMDGWDLAREIRSREYKTKIVLVTGYGNGLQLTGENRSLINSVISKPFNFEQLDETITGIFRKEEMRK